MSISDIQSLLQVLIDSFFLLFIAWQLFKAFLHIALREARVYVKRERDKRVWSRLRG
jgi:hypothetical protein